MVHFTSQLSGQTHPSIWSIYTQNRFNWTPSQIGSSLAVVGLMSTFVQGALTPKIISKWGEANTLKWGLLGYAIAFLFYGLITEGWMIYIVLVVSAVFWTTGPALQSLISKQVPPDQQGELQGSLFSLTSLASILCPLISTQLFAYFNNANPIGHYPGAPYYFAFFVASIGFFIIYTNNKITSKS